MRIGGKSYYPLEALSTRKKPEFQHRIPEKTTIINPKWTHLNNFHIFEN